MIRYIQASSDWELEQILALQQQNLPKHLTEEELRSQGFLTIEHTLDLLKEMNVVFPHTLAMDSEELVGYALSMSPKSGDSIELLRPLFSQVETLLGGTANYMVMGQICVAKSHRGKGIFRGLYHKMREFLPDNYGKIITEVDTRNIRSLQAHKAIGFRELKRYPKAGREWSLIVLP